MPKEIFNNAQSDQLLDLWTEGKSYEMPELRDEFRKIRTALSPTETRRLFPDDVRFKLPLITTPRMMEDLAKVWDEDWEESDDFSLAPALSSLIGRLREVAAEAHIIYNELGAYFRALMISNLLRSGWRPTTKGFEANLTQEGFNRDFESRMKRLVDTTHSDYWSLFKDRRGVLIWTTAQAEVLAFMENSTTWRKIFRRTQKDLAGKI